MFILLNESSKNSAPTEECLHAFLDLTYLSHQMYGHLSYNGLKTLKKRSVDYLNWKSQMFLVKIVLSIGVLVKY